LSDNGSVEPTKTLYFCKELYFARACQEKSSTNLVTVTITNQ